jgi:hypothetical protein
VGSKSSLWSGESIGGAVLRPGDAVMVPERAISGPIQWQLIFSAAQIASAVATSVFIATHP